MHTGWLIEWRGPDGQVFWWTGREHDQWTTDSLSAVRFCRARDAAQVMGFTKAPPGCLVTEHTWG